MAPRRHRQADRAQLSSWCAIDGYCRCHPLPPRRASPPSNWPRQALDQDKLAGVRRADDGESLERQLLNEPLGPKGLDLELVERLDRESSPRSRSRWLGLLARLIDSVLKMDLLLRGKVLVATRLLPT